MAHTSQEEEELQARLQESEAAYLKALSDLALFKQTHGDVEEASRLFVRLANLKLPGVVINSSSLPPPSSPLPTECLDPPPSRLPPRTPPIPIEHPQQPITQQPPDPGDIADGEPAPLTARRSSSSASTRRLSQPLGSWELKDADNFILPGKLDPGEAGDSEGRQTSSTAAHTPARPPSCPPPSCARRTPAKDSDDPVEGTSRPGGASGTPGHSRVGSGSGSRPLTSGNASSSSPAVFDSTDGNPENWGEGWRGAWSGGYEHCVEVFNLDATVKTSHLQEMLDVLLPNTRLSPYIRWADDNHAVLVCADVTTAQYLVDNAEDEGFSVRPFTHASQASKLLPQSELLPPKPRPKTTATVARKLLSHALGLPGLRDRAGERELAAARKEKKELRAAQRAAVVDAWGGDD